MHKPTGQTQWNAPVGGAGQNGNATSSSTKSNTVEMSSRRSSQARVWQGLQGGGTPHGGQNNPMRAGQNEWTQHFDEQSGQMFFANAATKETRWQNPKPAGDGERQLSTQHVVGGYAV